MDGLVPSVGMRNNRNTVADGRLCWPCISSMCQVPFTSRTGIRNRQSLLERRSYVLIHRSLPIYVFLPVSSLLTKPDHVLPKLIESLMRLTVNVEVTSDHMIPAISVSYVSWIFGGSGGTATATTA